MLDECAPGHRRKVTGHNVRIMYGAKTYHRFPIGGHGKTRGGNRYEVKFGHVRNLVNLFEIGECAKGHFSEL
jgi:hypothetical protein